MWDVQERNRLIEIIENMKCCGNCNSFVKCTDSYVCEICDKWHIDEHTQDTRRKA